MAEKKKALSAAYARGDDARTALAAGVKVLKAASKRSRKNRKALDFSAGCLMELERALTATVRPNGGRGVNPGCKG